jgi:hypothetical protein
MTGTAAIQRAGALFVAGAIVGTLLDRIHVAAGVLWYTHPALAGQAVWVPLTFGVGALLLMSGHLIFPPHERPAAPATLAAPALGLLLAYLATAALADRALLLTLVLLVAWIVRVLRDPTADKLAVAIAFALGGPIFEAMLSATGGFFYRQPDLLGVPVWLPALYLHVSLLTRQIALVWP